MGGKKKKDQKKQQQEQNQQQQQQQIVEAHLKKQKKKKEDKSKSDNQQEQQSTAKENKKVQLIQPKKVSYCPVCTMPFELCKYGKKAKQCLKLLASIAPTKVAKYHPDADLQNLPKQEIVEKQKGQQVKKQKKQKSTKQKYIVIDVKQRAKKKFVTTITGLQIFGIDSKQLSKICSKKFACSSSNIDADTAQIQGDVFEEVKQMLISDFKVKSKYIIDKQKYNEKFKQEMEKRKQQKNAEKNQQRNVIKQAKEKDQDQDQDLSKNKKNKQDIKQVDKEPADSATLKEKIQSHQMKEQDIDDI